MVLFCFAFWISNCIRAETALAAWPICISESDGQRRCPGQSPCTMGSRVLTPRTRVLTTARKDWSDKWMAGTAQLCRASCRGMMCHLFYFATGMLQSSRNRSVRGVTLIRRQVGSAKSAAASVESVISHTASKQTKAYLKRGCFDESNAAEDERELMPRLV